MENAQALLNQAQVQLDYAHILSPISGKVNVRAARQGEVVAAGTPIVTITDLTQTWIYAPLPETEADPCSGRQPARSYAERRDDSRQGDREICGGRLRHAARREPPQA